ncbi:MAG: pyrroline-5-carboxylate reductase [Bacillota bacterium]
MQYGFIGAGNMVSSILNGVLGIKKENTTDFKIDPKDIYITSKTVTSAKKLNETLGGGCVVCDDSLDIVANCDVVILGVKPHILEDVFPIIKEKIKEKNTIIVTIAAGKKIEFYQEQLGKEVKLVRVMPNINGEVGMATSCFCCTDTVTEAEKNTVKSLFETIGTMTEIEESIFPIFQGLAGSSIAFGYLYINALADGAVKAGMPKKQALAIIADSVIGCGTMVKETGEHPVSIVDRICSPKGVTIEGVTALEEAGFSASLRTAFSAMIEKDLQMSK